MKRIFYLIIAVIGIITCFSFNVNAQGGVGINVGGSPPDNSAGLDVNFTNKGELMPRLSTEQRNAIANPATGLFIFNTDCNVINYNAGTPSSPSWATVNATNALIAGLSISANPVGAICEGTSVTFTALPSNGINSPSYQWQVNGGNVGTNSSSYTTTGLNNGDVVTCILTTSEACVTGSPATSNSITMTVNPIPSTPGSITGNTSVCASTTGNIYSISPVAGATSYNWTVPGDATIASGSGNTSITVSFGSSSGNITVEAVNSCGSSAASSQAITVTSIPETPGAISGSSTVCPNTSGQVYSISAVSGATSYNWTVPSGASISANPDTIMTASFGANTVGNITVSASNFCGTSGQNTLSVTQASICPPYTFNETGSLQTFTVPSGVTSLTIEAFGAQGGIHAGGETGGNGADIKGTFTVTPGQTLSVIVGQQGVDDPNGNIANSGAGGGGGSFVYYAGPTLMIAAGGGGGGALYDDGSPRDLGDAGQSGTCGSQSKSCAAGGCAGSDGSGDLPGKGWNSIMSNPSGTGYGGYGGGGSAAYHGGGGGGGYSGGGGQSSGGCGASYGDGGGGGGSYNNGTNQTNTSGVQTGNGKVVFTW